MDDFSEDSARDYTATNSHEKDGALDAALIDLVPIPPEVRSTTNNHEETGTDLYDDPLGDIFS